MPTPRRFRRALTPRASAAGDEARRRTVDVAVDLFARQGYRGTPLDRVAEAAGLSRSGLLHHFPSKRALLQAVLDDLDERLGFADPAAPLPLGWAAFELLLEHPVDDGASRCFVALSAECIDAAHPARTRILRQRAALAAWLTTAVEHGVQHGELRRDTPVAAVVAEVCAAYFGIALAAAVEGETFDRDAALRELARSLRDRCGALVAAA